MANMFCWLSIMLQLHIAALQRCISDFLMLPGVQKTFVAGLILALKDCHDRTGLSFWTIFMKSQTFGGLWRWLLSSKIRHCRTITFSFSWTFSQKPSRAPGHKQHNVFCTPMRSLSRFVSDRLMRRSQNIVATISPSRRGPVNVHPPPPPPSNCTKDNTWFRGLRFCSVVLKATYRPYFSRYKNNLPLDQANNITYPKSNSLKRKL